MRRKQQQERFQEKGDELTAVKLEEARKTAAAFKEGKARVTAVKRDKEAQKTKAAFKEGEKLGECGTYTIEKYIQVWTMHDSINNAKFKCDAYQDVVYM
jgi:hypothetical protein